MARFELKLPKMGESVAEATVTAWLKEVGDTIEMDEAVLEIATDKVCSECTNEIECSHVEKLFDANDVEQVGETLAIIETDAEMEDTADVSNEAYEQESEAIEEVEKQITQAK